MNGNNTQVVEVRQASGYGYKYDVSTERYARCIEVSRRVRWEINRDVIHGRKFDFSKKFLPAGLIALVAAVDGLLQYQAGADVEYFLSICRRDFGEGQLDRMRQCMLKAYRWQYIVCGVRLPRFREVLGGMITPEQGKRIVTALTPIVN
jgi:hypothetical protein